MSICFYIQNEEGSKKQINLPRSTDPISHPIGNSKYPKNQYNSIGF